MGEALPALLYINGPVKSILKNLVLSARERRSKSHPTLCEAYSSLKACPIQFTSLRQLLPLAGFGEALVDKIQMLLCEWCIENGKSYTDTQVGPSRGAQIQASPTEEVEEETDSDLDMSTTRKSTAKNRKTKEKSNTVPKTAKQKAVVEKAPKTFIPQHRTGTHGILVALYTLTPNLPAQENEIPEGPEAESDDAGVDYYTKATVIHFGQPYSDSKYIPKSNPTVNGFGTSYHSAWSGMKTLINRGYVYRKGNPARFGLSHEGWKVAKICVERETGLSAGCNQSKVSAVPTVSATTNEDSSRKKKAANKKSAAEETTAMSPVTNAPFLYTYLTDSHPPEQTTNRDRASIRLSDEDYRMMYRVAFSSESKEHPFVINCVRDVAKEGDVMCGWVREAACNKVAPGLAQARSAFNDEPAKKKATRKGSKEEAILPSMEPTEEQQTTKIGEKALREQMSSQGNIIELLTSSDVEVDEMKCRLQVKTWTNHRRQESLSDSDSALSDLAPVVKQRKTGKGHRVVSK